MRENIKRDPRIDKRAEAASDALEGDTVPCQNIAPAIMDTTRAAADLANNEPFNLSGVCPVSRFQQAAKRVSPGMPEFLLRIVEGHRAVLCIDSAEHQALATIFNDLAIGFVSWLTNTVIPCDDLRERSDRDT